MTEVINGVVKIIDNQVDEGRETDLDEIMEIIKGPDFPTKPQFLDAVESKKRTVPVMEKSACVRLLTLSLWQMARTGLS